ncbi:MAG: hypothetical protein SNJ63_06645 [Sphingomonadaceae bacterium]
MLDKVTLGLAAAAAVGLVAKLVVTGQVADLQRQVAQRQQTIAAAQVLGQVNGKLIQLLASASVERNDPALRDLLARNGVTFSVSSGPSPAGTSGATKQ